VKLGAQPKKVAVLGVLTVVAGYFVLTGLFSGSGGPGPSPAPAPRRPVLEPAPMALPEAAQPVPRPERRTSARTTLQEFRPALRPKRGAERRDLSSIDPTLRLDLLVRLNGVKMDGGARSLFDFSAAPLPKDPEPKIIPAAKMFGPQPPPGFEEEGKPKAETPKPPIPLKFYGYVSQARQSAKRAFFLDGDGEILVASEGDVMKKRYRVVRVGVNSVVVEDVEQKHEQTLPLEAQTG
jgi:hypothetical protein